MCCHYHACRFVFCLELPQLGDTAARSNVRAPRLHVCTYTSVGLRVDVCIHLFVCAYVLLYFYLCIYASIPNTVLALERSWARLPGFCCLFRKSIFVQRQIFSCEPPAPTRPDPPRSHRQQHTPPTVYVGGVGCGCDCVAGRVAVTSFLRLLVSSRCLLVSSRCLLVSSRCPLVRTRFEFVGPIHVRKFLRPLRPHISKAHDACSLFEDEDGQGKSMGAGLFWSSTLLASSTMLFM